jgi:hypothetical protein
MKSLRWDGYWLIPRLLGNVAGGVWDGTEGWRRVVTKLNVMCLLWVFGKKSSPAAAHASRKGRVK